MQSSGKIVQRAPAVGVKSIAAMRQTQATSWIKGVNGRGGKKERGGEETRNAITPEQMVTGMNGIAIQQQCSSIQNDTKFMCYTQTNVLTDISKNQNGTQYSYACYSPNNG